MCRRFLVLVLSVLSQVTSVGWSGDLCCLELYLLPLCPQVVVEVYIMLGYISVV